MRESKVTDFEMIKINKYIYVRKHRLIAKNTKSITLLRFTYTDENNKIRLERQFSLKIISAKEAKKKKTRGSDSVQMFPVKRGKGRGNFYLDLRHNVR